MLIRSRLHVISLGIYAVRVHVVLIFVVRFKVELHCICVIMLLKLVTFITIISVMSFRWRRIILSFSSLKPKVFITFIRSLFHRRAPIWQID